jgi:hypothetical protein
MQIQFGGDILNHLKEDIALLTAVARHFPQLFILSKEKINS